jgi:hypothetical protein
MYPKWEGYMEEEFEEKPFGAVAIEKGFISMDQLLEGLEIQAEEEIEQGISRVIGAILVEKGYMNLSQVQEVLEDM